MQYPDLEKIRPTLNLIRYPVNLILELTTTCNLRCVACPYPSLKREKNRYMSEQLYRKIIDEIGSNSAHDTIVWYAFMGEPLVLGRDLIEKAQYARNKNVQHIYLNTNALLLDESMADGLIECGIEKVIVSLDASSASTYHRIRRGGNFDVVQKNVLRFAEKIHRYHGEKPELLVQFIVMDENESQEEEFKCFWLEHGVSVKIRRKLGWGGSIDSKSLDIPQNRRDMPCPWLMRQMVILWDGRVAQCDADYEGEYNAGTIHQHSIEDVWNGELLSRRKRHMNNDFDFEPCRQCCDWQVGLSEVYNPQEKRPKK